MKREDIKVVSARVNQMEIEREYLSAHCDDLTRIRFSLIKRIETLDRNIAIEKASVK